MLNQKINNTCLQEGKLLHKIKSINRQKEQGEVFTPTELILEIFNRLPNEIWNDKEKTWLDPTCGNGQFLAVIRICLLEFGHTEEHILNNMIFGVDLMDDNCKETIQRLYGPGTIRRLSNTKIPSRYRTKGLKHCYTHNGKLVPNIVCADGLEYNYSFGREPDPKPEPDRRQKFFDF